MVTRGNIMLFATAFTTLVGWSLQTKVFALETHRPDPPKDTLLALPPPPLCPMPLGK